jgi:hypothetical protein
VAKYLREAPVTHDSRLTSTLIEDEGQRLIDKAIHLALAEVAFTAFGEDADSKDNGLLSPDWAAWHDSEAPSLRSSHTITAAKGNSTPKDSRAPTRPQVSEAQLLEDHHDPGQVRLQCADRL